MEAKQEWEVGGNGPPAGRQVQHSGHEGLKDYEYYGLNCVLLKDAEVLMPTICECKRI